VAAFNLDLGRWQVSLSFVRPIAASGPRSVGLRLHVLGPFRAERGAGPIDDWGGPKAGRRQALGLFAFLFDRGVRGVDRDEVIDLIWPDADYARAELAFHRTLHGLRGVVATGWEKEAIAFTNGRYRLDERLIGWTDVAEFERLCETALGTAGHGGVELLEHARRLYRGDYLDDCPYYGDSTEVEVRRRALRSLAGGAMTRLAAHYQEQGLHGTALLRAVEVERIGLYQTASMNNSKLDSRLKAQLPPP